MIKWSINNAYLSGSDFFVSYSHLDGRFYATALSNLLQEKKYSCYLDMHTSQPGKITPKTVLRQLSSANVLVVISTIASQTSHEVQKEIELFIKMNMPIIIIGRTIAEASVWKHLVIGLPVNIIPDETMLNGVVDQNFVDLLINSLTYTRQCLRIRQSVISALITLVVVLLIFMITFYYFTNSMREINKKMNIETAKLKLKNDSLIKIEIDLQKVRLQYDTARNNLIRSQKEKQILNGNLSKSLGDLRIGDADGKYLYNKVDSLRHFINQLAKDERLYISEYETQLKRQDARQGILNHSIKNETSPTGPASMGEHCIIVFEFDSAVLSTMYYPLIDEISNVLRSSDKSIEIRSYSSKIAVTEDSGKRKVLRWGLDDFYFPQAKSVHSIKLAKQRAQALKTYLVNSGVDEKKIKIKAFGQSREGATFNTFIREWLEVVVVQ